jgi:hypothetical protein
MGTQGGFGVKVQITVGSVLTAIAHILEMDYPEFEKVLYDRTAHDSPEGYAEFGDSGKRKVSDFKVTLEWDMTESTHAAILAAFDSADPVSMAVKDPEATETISGNAYIQKVGRIAKQEEGYQCEVTIQPTGKWSIT